MKDHLIAAIYTLVVIAAVGLFAWLAAITNGAAIVVLLLTVVVGIVYTMIYSSIVQAREAREKEEAWRRQAERDADEEEARIGEIIRLTGME